MLRIEADYLRKKLELANLIIGERLALGMALTFS